MSVNSGKGAGSMGAKSRGNWNIGWCPRVDCMHRDTNKCEGCFRYSEYEKEDCDENPIQTET